MKKNCIGIDLETNIIRKTQVLPKRDAKSEDFKIIFP